MLLSSALRKLSLGLIALVSLTLGGCGGGGGSSTPASNSLSGTSAVGYPIVGGAVQVKCAAGAALTTTTSSTGTWQVTLNSQTLPCAVAVSGGTINSIANSTSYHSIAISAGVINVTPFTDLMVANLTAQNPGMWFTGLTPALLTALTQAQVNTVLANLRAALSGLAPLATINPITTSFSAIPGNTMDDLLAALQLAMSNTGSTYTTLLNAASTSSFATVVAALNAALPAAYATTPSGTPPATGSNPGITGVFPTSGSVGASVTISGTNFRQGSGGITSGDAYRVSFNGTTATPYMRTLTQLGVIVPVGATSGTLTVTDLITNQVYTVLGGFTVTGTTGGAISATAITTAQNLTVGTAMTNFSPLTASGGTLPYTYSYTGTLPAGLTFSTTTGVVSGTPSAVYATANLVFSVKDADNVVASATSTVSFTVSANTVVGVQMGGARQGTPLNLSTAVTTLAGSGTIGAADAMGTVASFNRPAGVTTDGINLYVTDLYNNKIRKIVIATGVVTTLAGSGVLGAADGTGTAASFSMPVGITTDGINLYVTDSDKIRKIVIATGVVTTLAGSSTRGSVDGTGTNASFLDPNGITTDGINLYVADYSNNKIRKIVIATSVVTTLAGSGAAGTMNGTGTAASFYSPYGITTDGINLYVTEVNNIKVRKIAIATGVVTTMAGSGTIGSIDGAGTAASFNFPAGITTDGTNLYVVDSGNNKVRKIVIATSVVTTLAGSGTAGTADGTGTAASFYLPVGITSDGTNLYVADTSNNKIRKIQ